MAEGDPPKRTADEGAEAVGAAVATREPADLAPQSTIGTKIDDILQVFGRYLVPRALRGLGGALDVVFFGRIRRAFSGLAFVLGALLVGAGLVVATLLGVSIGYPLALFMLVIGGGFGVTLFGVYAVKGNRFTTPELNAAQEAKGLAAAEHEAIDQFVAGIRRDGKLPLHIAAEVQARRTAVLNKQLRFLDRANPEDPAKLPPALLDAPPPALQSDADSKPSAE